MNEDKGKFKIKLHPVVEIISVSIILGILAFMIYMAAAPGPVKSPHDYNSCTCHDGCAECIEGIYGFTRDELRIAIVDYTTRNNGSFPVLNDTYSNICCQNCSVININALLIVNGGLLREAPESSYLSASGDDNCGGNASLGCHTESSYIWLINASGDIFSYCAGVRCATNNTCWQGVYP